jgi:hypothetical protein
VIEDPVEIIDNERELKGFNNMDEVIKLAGYFKSEKSPRRWSLSKVILVEVYQIGSVLIAATRVRIMPVVLCCMSSPLFPMHSSLSHSIIRNTNV